MLFSVSLGAVLRGECRRKEQRRKAHTLRHQHLIDEKEEREQAKTEEMRSTACGVQAPMEPRELLRDVQAGRGKLF